jgi:hypothetical protein
MASLLFYMNTHFLLCIKYKIVHNGVHSTECVYPLNNGLCTKNIFLNCLDGSQSHLHSIGRFFLLQLMHKSNREKYEERHFLYSIFLSTKDEVLHTFRSDLSIFCNWYISTLDVKRQVLTQT